MVDLSNYLRFELPCWLYFNCIHAITPTLKYKDTYLADGWYVKHVYEGNSLVYIPREAFLRPGKIFLDLILNKDEEFCDYLYNLSLELISFTDKLQELNFQDIRSGKVTSIGDFLPDYKWVFGQVIAFGYALDAALDEYLKENNLDASKIPAFGISFLQKEERDLKQIQSIADESERRAALLRHADYYSWVHNNYTGEHRPSLSYFEDRLPEVAQKKFEEHPKDLQKPQTIMEWIGFLTYLRDERKRCNLIADGLLDRYLHQECARLGFSYRDAAFLTFDEFEDQKGRGHLDNYNGLRYTKGTHEGIVNFSEDDWKSMFEGEVLSASSVEGSVACRGRAVGPVRIVLNTGDFSKVQQGDILVASMTRPEFAPILSRATAIVTNEGGVTCHAAIVSRELGIPCIIGTRTATQMLKDGDLVEVDAEQGVVRIIK